MLIYYDEERFQRYLKLFFEEIDKARISRTNKTFEKVYDIMIKCILECYKEI